MLNIIITIYAYLREGVKKIDFLALTPHENTKKLKVDFFRFFIYQSQRNVLKWTIMIKNKGFVADLPDKIQKYLCQSRLQNHKCTLKKNGLNKKNYSVHADVFFYILSEKKNRFFQREGVQPRPPLLLAFHNCFI